MPLGCSGISLLRGILLHGLLASKVLSTRARVAVAMQASEEALLLVVPVGASLVHLAGAVLVGAELCQDNHYTALDLGSLKE